MITVYKYDIAASETFYKDLPIGAIFRHVAEQNGLAQMWFEVNTNNPVIMRKFCTIGTGCPLAHANAKFLGTFFVQNGLYVFHLYELV